MIFLPPNSYTNFFFFSEVLKTSTVAPIFTAHCTAKWPKPPQPSTATWSPFYTVPNKGVKVVIPAHIMGAIDL